MKPINFFPLVLLISNITLAQSYNMGLSTDINLALNIEGDIGYSFTDRDLLYGGIKLQSYKLYGINDEIWNDNHIFNTLLITGGKYLFPITKTKKETTIGLCSDIRMYFNPFVPRKFKYTDINNKWKTAEGDYDYQFAYGLGFGIYFEKPETGNYLTLFVEYSNLDAFKTLRTLNVYQFPKKTFLTIGISIFKW